MNLSPHEIKLIAKLLEIASDKFSNHGCNDFKLTEEAELTPEESYEINRAYVEWSDPNWKEDYSEDHLRGEYAIAGDDGPMAYMSARLSAQLEEGDRT
jgi:hypothetical protein